MSQQDTIEAPLGATAERQAVLATSGEAPGKDWVIVTRGLKRDYDMGGVASDVYERMVARGTLKANDFRIIYKSPIFPTSSFAFAHDLKPDLAKKIIESEDLLGGGGLGT